MSRQSYPWSVGLDDETFALLLLLIGHTGRRGETLESPIRWSATQPFVERLDAAAAKSMAAHWRTRLASRPARLGVEVIDSAWAPPPTSPQWLIDTLRRAPGVSSVWFSTRWSERAFAWDWPLDVALLDGPSSQRVRADLQSLRWAPFVRLVDAGSTSSQIDLLLVPGEIPDALALSMRVALPRVHTALVLDDAGTSAGALAALEALRTQLGAVVAGAVGVSAARVGVWLDQVLFELSHDRSLDEALFAAGPRMPMIVGAPGSLPLIRVSQAGINILREFAALAPAVKVPVDLLGRLGADDASNVATGAALRAKVKALRWESERGAATDFARLAHHVEADVPAGAAAQPRFLQARVIRPADTASSPRRRDIQVRVARHEQGWVHDAPRFPRLPDPASQPTDQEQGHEVIVFLVAPALGIEPQSARLWLPLHGDSEVCTFGIDVPEAVTQVGARITVLHRNRILQTLTLQASTGSLDDLRAVPETALRVDVRELAGAPGFDAALLLNDVAGEPGLTTFAGDASVYLRLDPGGVGELVDRLTNELQKITRTPADFAGLDSEATRQLLVCLARGGSNFGLALSELPGMGNLVGKLDRPGRLQVLSIHPDKLFPLEFVYDRAFPDKDAALCAALRGGRDCDAGCVNNENTVCPQGFWGMRHVIERQLYDTHVAEELQRTRGVDFVLAAEGQNRAQLASLRAIAFAAADKARKFDPASFDAVVDGLRADLGVRGIDFVRSNDWMAWATDVTARGPELLVLLPHTDEEMGAAILEIGAAAHLAVPQVRSHHVRHPAPTPPAPGPVVLLLGCRTAQEDLPFSSFVSAFRRAKASVIVATLSTVRGRHMAPVAQEVIKRLLEGGRGPGRSMGELIRELRRQLLGRGLPIGLTLVAFGDVDWRLGGAA